MERRILRENEEEIVLLKEEEDDDEALSLCDLPNNEEKNQTKKEVLAQDNQDFDFNSCGGNLLNESEMCTADQVFYKGQILPLRHSISFPSDRRSRMMDSILRSESMDHCHDTNSSSRSSSIRSQRSSSSGSSSNYKPKIRNQFHSHPSPTPQVRFTKVVQTNLNTNKSTLWSLFRVGLVTTPEIALQDLKTRSRNSNDDKKKKERFFLGGNCKCSANSVEEPRIVVRKTRKKTEKDKKEIAPENVKGNRKQAMSRHRTFEWLRQLSLEEEGHPVDETKRLHQSITHA